MYPCRGYFAFGLKVKNILIWNTKIVALKIAVKLKRRINKNKGSSTGDIDRFLGTVTKFYRE